MIQNGIVLRKLEKMSAFCSCCVCILLLMINDYLAVHSVIGHVR